MHKKKLRESRIFLFNGYVVVVGSAFPGRKAAVELTTHFHRKQNSRMLGAILPFLHTSSCHARVKFYFSLYLMVEWKYKGIKTCMVDEKMTERI
jgi:hypothetical protein